MLRKYVTVPLACVLCVITLAIAGAAETKIGNLVIESPTIRGTVPTAKVAAGYLIIENTGNEADRLLGAKANFADSVQIHEMKVTDGIMTMRPLGEGLLIPAGKAVTLKRGAEHLMFMKLAEPMTESEIRTVTLTFEKAGQVDVSFSVGNLAGDLVDHSAHGDHGSYSGHDDH